MKHLIVTAILAGALAGCVGGDGSEPATVNEGVDVLHVSDLVMVNIPETDGVERIAIECDSEECTISYEGDTETFTLEEWIPMADDEPTDDLDEFSRAGGVAIYREFAMEPLEGGGHFEGTALGAWMEHNSFGVVSANVDGGELDGFKLVAAASQGVSGALPVAGSADWIGAMAGIDYGSPRSPSLVARAELRIPDLSTPRVDIAFTERTDDGDDMRWAGIPVYRSSFRRGEGADRIEGTFYGPQAAEVGGIFEHDQIIGAFGAKR